MTNKNYPVRPDGNPKVAPVKKKDIHDSLQDANQSAEKLHEQMTELNTKFSIMQESGVTTRLDAHSEKLINNLLAQMKATPKDVEKVLNLKMDKVIEKHYNEITKIKKYAVVATVIINTLIALLAVIL